MAEEIKHEKLLLAKAADYRLLTIGKSLYSKYFLPKPKVTWFQEFILIVKGIFRIGK